MSEAGLNDEGKKEKMFISGLINPQYYPATTQRVAQGVHTPPPEHVITWFSHGATDSPG